MAGCKTLCYYIDIVYTAQVTLNARTLDRNYSGALLFISENTLDDYLGKYVIPTIIFVFSS